MRSFATVAILTALVGFLLGAALAATDPNLGQGGSIAMAADEAPANGLLGGVVQMVGKPLMRALNLAGGPVIKVDVQKPEQKLGQTDGAKADKPAAAGTGGGNKR